MNAGDAKEAMDKDKDDKTKAEEYAVLAASYKVLLKKAEDEAPLYVCNDAGVCELDEAGEQLQTPLLVGFMTVPNDEKELEALRWNISQPDGIREDSTIVPGDGLYYTRVEDRHRVNMEILISKTSMRKAGSTCLTISERHLACFMTETPVTTADRPRLYMNMDIPTWAEILHSLFCMVHIQGTHPRGIMPADELPAHTVAPQNLVESVNQDVTNFLLHKERVLPMEAGYEHVRCAFCAKPGAAVQCGECTALYCNKTCQAMDWRMEDHEKSTAHLAGKGTVTTLEFDAEPVGVICAFCKKRGAPVRCSICKVPYCDAECQEDDWQGHKQSAMHRAAVDAAGGKSTRFQIQFTGGGDLGMEVELADGRTRVKTARAGGLAEAMGVRVGDVIVGVGSRAHISVPVETIYSEWGYLIENEKPLIVTFERRTRKRPLEQQKTAVDPADPADRLAADVLNLIF